MASIVSDSELMTNYASAAAVPPTSHFAALRDDKGRPLIVCLSDPSPDAPRKLQIIMESEGSSRSLYDLSKPLGITTSMKILAFDAKQTSDGRVFLVFAVQSANDKATLSIVKPFRLLLDVLLSGTMRLQYVPGPEAPIGTVHQISLNPPRNSDAYPLITLMHKPLGRTGDGSDVSIVSVKPLLDSSFVLRERIVRENALEIIDFAPAITKYGAGAYCLYSIQGERHIMVLTSSYDAGLDEFYDREALLKCPSDASCLASYSGDDGYTSLLVSCADGLTYFDTDSAAEGGILGQLVSTSPLFQSCRQLTIAQEGSRLAIWTVNSADELGYMRTDRAQFHKGTPVLLLPAGQASTFQPLLQETPGAESSVTVQSLIINDSQGNLSMLTQASDTGLWQNEPLYVSDSRKTYEISSYTTRILLRDEHGAALNSGRAFITTAALAQATCNGRRVNLTQSGAWFLADESGEITFITPTRDIGTPAMTVEKLKTANGQDLTLKPVIVDPAKKVLDRLSHINEDYDFNNATTQSGKKLFESGSAPDKETLKSAASCFKQLNMAYTALPDNGSSIATAAGALSVNSATIITRTALEKVGDVLWDAWHYIEQKIKDVRDWIVEKVGGVWRFACKLAGEVKEFVLDCVEKVGRAASWVFEKIKIGWEKLCDFVGFLFSWGDIIDTKNTLSGLLTSNLSFVQGKVEAKRAEVRETFKSVRKIVADAVYPKKIKASVNAEGKNPKANSATSGSAFNMTSYHMKNGSMDKNSQLAEGGSRVGTNRQESDDLWSTLTKIWEGIQAALGDLCDKIGESFFGNGKSIDLDVIFTILGDILTSCVDGVAAIVDKILELAAKFIKLMNEYGNKEIKIPIFSALYKRVSGGKELTVFDAVCLLIAIPTTVLIKIVTGKAPPKLPSIDIKFVKAINDPNDNSLTKQTRIDYNTLMTGAGVSFVLIGTAWKTIKFLWSLARKGTGGALNQLESKTPFPAITILSMSIECVGLMASVATISDDLPAADLRRWMITLGAARVGINTVFMFNGWDADEVGEKFLLGVDLAVALANFGLYQAVCVAEVNAIGWKEKDEGITAIGSVASLFSTLASVGYFMAFFFKEKEPNTSGLGLALEKIGSLALVAVETGLFFEQYERHMETRLVIAT